MAAGFALNAAVPGLGAAMGGFAVPALVGGGMALMTGSLEKGLMAGLGAYGGANLGANFGGARYGTSCCCGISSDSWRSTQATAAQSITNQFGNVAANGIPAGQTQAYIDATKAPTPPLQI
jgi:hypothetical protein